MNAWELVYDGECTFCRWCVDYARAATMYERPPEATTVTYRAYQDAAPDHADVTTEQFAASIQLFTPDGRFEGARAALMVLALVPRLSGWLMLYRYVPGFAALAEWSYRAITRRRNAVFRLTKACIGAELTPLVYTRTSGVIERGTGFCALIAFLSFGWQADALIGADGILPVADSFRALEGALGAWGVFAAPSLFWLAPSATTTWVLVCTGVAASLLLVGRRFVVPAALVAYFAYLSLFYAGRVFMAFQWDLLLLEALVAVAVLGWRQRIGIWVVRLLIFRFMLMSGAVKLMSGDPAWSGLDALTFHFETQPLPTVFAWYAHALPATALVTLTWLTLAVELVLPFLVFAPRRLRFAAACAFVVLELAILLTGNYNFFNLLTIVLCVALFDDKRLRGSRVPAGTTVAGRGLGRGVLAAFFVLNALQLHGVFGRLTAPEAAVMRAVDPWQIVNRYGLFAVMTRERRELVIEWSRDGAVWTEAMLPFKPGALDVPPRWIAPHQPRLDWQMWFAALGGPDRSPWMEPLLTQLLRGSPPVRSLFATPPPNGVTLVRVLSYRYRFTDAAERTATGNWWRRDDPVLWLSPRRFAR